MDFLANNLVPAIVTGVVHAIIFVALAFSWEGSEKRTRIVPPNYVEAKLVKLEDKTKKKASAKKKPKKIDLTARKKEQARLKREAEKKRKAKLKKEAEAKKAAEKKKKEEQKKREADAERKREKEREQRLQQEFEQALAEEEGMLLEEEYASEAQSFTSKIRQRVENNWARPPSARTGMTCTLAIQLVPTGRIVSVDVAKSSGNGAFDRSAIQAVKKVEVFPEVKDMSPEVFERYYRKFNFLFDPQDLRL
ncbi:MAG: cell envelope integrity protein TolA [Agarilytica sp.]